MPDVKVPLIGNVPRAGVILGGVAGLGVLGYAYWKKKQAAAVTAQGTQAAGYGAYAYGYGAGPAQGYYGYGYGYGGIGGGITPYPMASEYGYGAYGYGYYNPYTGQWIGPAPTQPPTTPPSSPGGGSGQKTTHTVSASGSQNIQALARIGGITREQLIDWNPHLKKYLNTGKSIPKGTRVKI